MQYQLDLGLPPQSTANHMQRLTPVMGGMPDRGYFGFARYGEENITVENVSVTATPHPVVGDPLEVRYHGLDGVHSSVTAVGYRFFAFAYGGAGVWTYISSYSVERQWEVVSI